MLSLINFTLRHTVGNWLSPKPKKIIRFTNLEQFMCILGRTDPEKLIHFRLKVLASDCQTSQYISVKDCAVTRALRRLLDPQFDVTTGPYGFTIWQKGCLLFRGKIPSYLDQYNRSARNGEDFYLPVEVPRKFLQSNLAPKPILVKTDTR